MNNLGRQITTNFETPELFCHANRCKRNSIGLGTPVATDRYKVQYIFWCIYEG